MLQKLRIHGLKFIIRSLILCLSLPVTVFAVDAPNVPNIVNPGLNIKPRTQLPIPSGQPAPSFKPPAEKTQATFPQAEKIRFKLTQVKFIGNTVFTQAQLATIVKPSFNKVISLADLQNLTNQITQKYWEAGYILSRAILPPQQIKNGLVTIQVVEGYISQVNVTGNSGRATAKIQAYGNNITQSKPLNVKDLERNLLLANDIPGAQVKAVLTPSPNTPASSNVALVTQQSPGQAYLSYDNFGTRYLGPQEVTLGGNLNSLFTSGDTTSARIMATTQTKEMNYFELTHAMLLGADGTRLFFGGNYSKTAPGNTLTPLEILGISRSLFADVSYPWLRTRTQNLSFHSGINYQNVTTNFFGGPLYDDHIRSLIVGTRYSSTDSWQGINNAGLDAEHGFDILGASNSGQLSRPGGRADFSKLSLNASRIQYLTSRISLFGATQGQYAFTPLLASEQFGFGGPDFGRGFDPYEISGDHGAAAKLELRLDTNPEFALIKAIQYYAFYDAGVVWNINAALTGQPARAAAISTGLGARFTFTNHVAGNVFVAQPLNRPVASAQAAGDNGKAPRGFFQLTAYL